MKRSNRTNQLSGVVLILGVVCVMLAVYLTMPTQRYRNSLRIGARYFDNQEYEKAVLSFQNAIRITESHEDAPQPEPHVYLGYTYAAMGDESEGLDETNENYGLAIDEMEAAREIDAEDQSITVSEAVIYVNKATAEAEADAELAMEDIGFALELLDGISTEDEELLDEIQDIRDAADFLTEEYSPEPEDAADTQDIVAATEEEEETPVEDDTMQEPPDYLSLYHDAFSDAAARHRNLEATGVIDEIYNAIQYAFSDITGDGFDELIVVQATNKHQAQYWIYGYENSAAYFMGEFEGDTITQLCGYRSGLLCLDTYKGWADLWLEEWDGNGFTDSLLYEGQYDDWYNPPDIEDLSAYYDESRVIGYVPEYTELDVDAY